MDTLHIYIDGSHIKGTQIKGFGGYCLHNNIEYRFSGIGSVEFMSKVFGIHNTKYISNPTMELVACAVALKSFEDKYVNLIIYADYQGVENWLTGKWNPRKTYIKKLVAYCQKQIKLIHGTVKFIHVKAHSGVKGNEEADKAAKQLSEYNEFINIK